jgi:outer membrane protein
MMNRQTDRVISEHLRRYILCASILLVWLFPFWSAAEDAKRPLSLEESIQLAIRANLAMKQSREEISAAQANKNISRSNFLPTLSATYSYTHRDKEQTQDLTGTPFDIVIRPQDEYAFVTSFRQPIFSGFALINQYKIASLGLNAAEIRAKLTRQDVILDAKNAYFTVLKAQKLLEVSKQTVEQITARKEVSENFYQVGMSPLNDLLQAQVELANAKQRLIVAQNDLDIAKSQFNLVLRRSVNRPVNVEEIVDYTPFEHDIDYCLSQANQNRLEIYVADVEVEIAEKEVGLAQQDYYPSIDLTGTITQIGDDWKIDGGEGISDSYSWNVQATATWNFWEWGRTTYGIKEKLSRSSQSKYRRSQVLDNINLEVKQAYLRTKESEKNITTIEKAIEQAKENYRITDERYKEQVATSTDLLTAQVLLTQTMTNYFTALYDFKIAKATLFRAMGQEVME